MKIIFTTFFALIFSALTISAQIPPKIAMEIIKAEDARRYDLVLEGLLKWPGIDLRSRAALAAGRIGDDRAIPALSQMAENDASDQARAMAVFAIGEIESAKGVDAIINFLEDPKTSDAVRARAVEAAGKIAAANARDPKAKDLAAAILRTLDREQKKQTTPSTEVIRMGLTAALRARSVGSEETLRKFLAFTDPNIVSDALNTMSRLRARNANRDARDLLATSVHGVVRANAARLLGVAEDKDAFDVLLTAATKDADSRVRVSAIRSLAGLKDAKAADRLIEYGNGLLANAKGITNSPEKSELLELATTVSRLVPNSNNEKAIAFLQSIRVLDRFSSAETEISLATVAPAKYVAEFRSTNNGYGDRHAAEAYAQGIGSIAASKDEALKTKAREALMTFVSGMATSVKPAYQREMVKAMPELQRAVAAFKPDNLDQIMRDALANDDVNVRADAAGMIAGLPYSKENVEALNKAFSRAFIMDKTSDDAMLSIMGALYRLDKKGSVGSFLVALDSPDYLVRKRAFEMLSDKDIQAASPGVVASLENALAKHKDRVLPYSPAFGTKLGQVLNTALDYRRALARKNGTVKAVFTTEKGTFTIDFYPEDAPLTVDNFVKLARTGYFNGLEVHRVVPNFVMQDGDPRGDGNGGPGWSIRCEVNMREYDRGAVGMALSGKDTGGSQWFVTHSPQPHLDGGYTVFGHVNETGMKVVDNIVRGDKIISVRIVGR